MPRIAVDRPYAIVGSSKDCDLTVESDRVARHAVLFLAINGNVKAVVLAGGSKHSGRSVRVRPDRSLKLGKSRILVDVVDDNRKHSTFDPTEPDDANDVYAATWKSQDFRHFLHLHNQRPILIGRKSPCQIRINDHRLSGQHACVLRVGEQLWVIDLKSANGITVGRERVAHADIAPDKSMVLADKHRVHFVRLRRDVHKSVATDQQLQRELLNEYELELQQGRAQIGELMEELSKSEAIRRSLESQIAQTQRNEFLLGSELQQRDRELNEIAAKHTEQSEKLNTIHDQLGTVSRNLDEVRNSRDELRGVVRRLEHDLVLAKSTESADAIRVRERELATLQEELEAEREILNHLKLQVRSNERDTQPATSEDETCISSFDFQDTLEKALEGLPSIDDKT